MQGANSFLLHQLRLYLLQCLKQANLEAALDTFATGNIIVGLFFSPHTILESIAANPYSYNPIVTPDEEKPEGWKCAVLSGVELEQWIGIVVYMEPIIGGRMESVLLLEYATT